LSWRESTSFGRIKFTHPTSWSIYTKALSYAATIPILKYAILCLTDGGTLGTPIIAMSNGTNWVSYDATQTVIIGDVLSMAVSPGTKTLTIGQTQQLIATVTTNLNAPTTVTWASANDGIASVSAGGLVTWVSAGGAVNITATSVQDGTKTAVCAVTCS
jgi:uncharacterized protein YjdB